MMIVRDNTNGPKGQTDWARVDAMTDDGLTANALSDPENPPLTAESWENARVNVNGVRMTREEFHTYKAAQNPTPTPDALCLDPDVRAAFPTLESVNNGLRLLLRLRAELTQSLPA